MLLLALSAPAAWAWTTTEIRQAPREAWVIQDIRSDPRPDGTVYINYRVTEPTYVIVRAHAKFPPFPVLRQILPRVLRQPGVYQERWDGRDESGLPLEYLQWQLKFRGEPLNFTPTQDELEGARANPPNPLALLTSHHLHDTNRCGLFNIGFDNLPPGSKLRGIAVVSLAAGDKKSLIIENDDYLITLARERESYTMSGMKELVFSIHKKRPNQIEEVSISGRIRQITELIVAEKTKLLAVGELPRGGDTISIIDLIRNEHQDTIWAYGYSFSPSKKFLAYVSHYPPYGLPELRQSIILVYDFSKSPAENRLPTTINMDAIVTAPGLPVFPERNVEKQTYDVTIDAKHDYISPILWSDDENTLVFVEFYKGHCSLVSIDISDGIKKPGILRKMIDIKDLIKWDILMEVTKKEIEPRPNILSIKTIRWKDKGSIIVEPFPQYYLDKEIELRLP
jgi:hypothetical protein